MKKIFFAVLFAAVAAQANLPEGFQAEVQTKFQTQHKTQHTWSSEFGIYKDVITDDVSAKEQIKKSSAYNWDAFLGTSEKIRIGRNRGSNILHTASLYENGKFSELFYTVDSHLLSTKIKWPKPGYDFKGCDDGTIAFVIVIGGVPQPTIYLCALAISEYLEEKSMAQVLIHESAHLTGFRNECDATTVEVGAMLFSGEGLAFRNGYMTKCGY